MVFGKVISGYEVVQKMERCKFVVKFGVRCGHSGVAWSWVVVVGVFFCGVVWMGVDWFGATSWYEMVWGGLV